MSFLGGDRVKKLNLIWEIFTDIWKLDFYALWITFWPQKIPARSWTNDKKQYSD